MKRDYKEHPLKRGEKPFREDFEELYLQNNYTRIQLAEYFGKSEGTIKDWTRYFNIFKDQSTAIQNSMKTKLEKYGSACYNNQEKSRQTNLEKYGVEKPLQNKEILKKVQQTNLTRYGIINPSKLNEFKEKAKKTKLKKYGYEFYTNLDKMKESKLEKYGYEFYTNREKWNKTMLEKYGAKYPLQNKEILKKAHLTNLTKYGYRLPVEREEIKQKIINTNLEKYNCKWTLSNPEVRKKGIITNNEKYGVDNYTKTNEYKNKSYETKKKNNSFNISQPEEKAYLLLQEKFGDVKRQYRSKKYPFACDFYVPILDLYIELNYHWTHNKEPFNILNEQHLQILNEWKNKNTDYYNSAIYVWTKQDVKKKYISELNNINILVFYNEDDFLNWIE